MMGKMMTSDDKTSPAPKNGTDVKKEAAAKKDEGQVKDKTTSDADLSKAEGGEKTANSPAGYSRGEGQKPVSKAYKNNWNAIYAKKKKKKRSFNSPRTALTPQTPLRCGTSRYRATLRRLDSPTRSAIANVAPNRQGGGSTAPKATIAVLGRMRHWC
jgi:hypothetical protein